MRIRDAYTKLDRAGLAQRAADARKSTTGGSPSANGADGTDGAGGATHVTVSTRARDLSALAAPRAAKVAALRAQVERGELRIDAGTIAARLLGDIDP
jgi:flagellar biosynthesis anti-sigma factor FlgM